MVIPENSRNELQKLLDEHHEWLLIHALGRSFPLKNREIEFEFIQDKLLFSYLDDKGFQTWRIIDYKLKEGEIRLNLSRNFDREHEKIRLVPRISARELSENLELTRLERANKIAGLISETFPETKLVRIELNKENGRFAQIIFENVNGKQTAVLADVSDSLTPEILLSAACFWQAKLSARRKNPVETVWIVSEKKRSKSLQKLHALLRENWKDKILIKEISRADAKAQSEEIRDLARLKIADLRHGKTAEIRLSENTQTSETARKIIEFAPAEIDVVFSKNGETLRFSGLPFARLRRVLTEEKVWFGIEAGKQILAEDNFGELIELIDNLQTFRRFDAPNKQHAFYTLAPEAWLESILRKNINLLDGNLILSPIYHQFRAGREQIDLLALRRDGRLVVIELKVAPDREIIFQTADYWRKIERQRRSGNLQKARLFGDLEIADAPAICYLVAPTLSFHRDFDFLASAISPEIEIYRFDLNENWREKIRILQRR